MATLNVKNFPDALYKKLQAQAKRERRSVAQEVTRLLTEALDVPKRLSILDLKGLGKAHWRGVDAAEHVKEERAAWDWLTPDSLQLAASLASACTAFVTNDRRLPAIPEMRVLQLADYVSWYLVDLNEAWIVRVSANNNHVMASNDLPRLALYSLRGRLGEPRTLPTAS